MDDQNKDVLGEVFLYRVIHSMAHMVEEIALMGVLADHPMISHTYDTKCDQLAIDMEMIKRLGLRKQMMDMMMAINRDMYDWFAKNIELIDNFNSAMLKAEIQDHVSSTDEAKDILKEIFKGKDRETSEGQ